jgi:hypothetical protein
MGIAASKMSMPSTTPKQYRCNTCDKTFNSVEELGSHQRMEHIQSSRPPARIS